MVLVGSACEELISHGTLSTKQVWVVAFGLGTISIITTTMQLLHRGANRFVVRKEFRVGFRLFVALALYCSPLFFFGLAGSDRVDDKWNLGFLGCECLLVLILVGFDAFSQIQKVHLGDQLGGTTNIFEGTAMDGAVL